MAFGRVAEGMADESAADSPSAIKREGELVGQAKVYAALISEIPCLSWQTLLTSCTRTERPAPIISKPAGLG